MEKLLLIGYYHKRYGVNIAAWFNAALSDNPYTLNEDVGLNQKRTSNEVVWLYNSLHFILRSRSKLNNNLYS